VKSSQLVDDTGVLDVVPSYQNKSTATFRKPNICPSAENMVIPAKK